MIDTLKQILCDVLQMEDRVNQWDESTPLLGAVAELDSMAVVAILTQVEEEFGVVIADEDVSADTFQTLGTLYQFVQENVG